MSPDFFTSGVPPHTHTLTQHKNSPNQPYLTQIHAGILSVQGCQIVQPWCLRRYTRTSGSFHVICSGFAIHLKPDCLVSSPHHKEYIITMLWFWIRSMQTQQCFRQLIIYRNCGLYEHLQLQSMIMWLHKSSRIHLPTGEIDFGGGRNMHWALSLVPQPTCSWKWTSRYISVGEPDYAHVASCSDSDKSWPPHWHLASFATSEDGQFGRLVYRNLIDKDGIQGVDGIGTY